MNPSNHRHTAKSAQAELSTLEKGLVEMLRSAPHRDAIIGAVIGPTTDAGETKSEERVLSYPETASAIHKTTRTVIRLCDEGHLTRVRFPGRRRSAGVLASSVATLLKVSSNGSTP